MMLNMLKGVKDGKTTASIPNTNPTPTPSWLPCIFKQSTRDRGNRGEKGINPDVRKTKLGDTGRVVHYMQKNNRGVWHRVFPACSGGWPGDGPIALWEQAMQIYLKRNLNLFSGNPICAKETNHNA